MTQLVNLLAAAKEKRIMKKQIIVGIALATVQFLTGCSQFFGQNPVAATPVQTRSTVPIAAGGGAGVPGTGAASVPTGDAVVARIRNGLNGNVSPAKGNFAKTLAQVNSNLPKVTDPTKASGFDQVELLVYGACSDLTTGSTPLMKSAYHVNPKASIAVNQSSLLAAGMAMLDKHTAGLASKGPPNAEVVAALTALIQQIASDSNNNSTIAFMSICTAANTAGVTMLGF
jgi:hypothetical protein